MMSKTRKPLIAGNWKMHNTLAESEKLAYSIAAACRNKSDRDILIAPSHTALNAVYRAIKGSGILLAAQDIYWEEKGAFTGAVSPLQVKDAGATHSIIGHSERRSVFGDTDEIVNKKLKAALTFGLIPILCVGETLTQREQNKTEDVLTVQLKNGLKDLTKKEIPELIIAYEPVWAIGTGKTATPNQAQLAHKFARQCISGLYDKETAQKIRILYGGSVKPENSGEIMAESDIDGVLVGGASLKPESFIRIIDFKNIGK
jgi:triosephosphate isomerase